jgi:hypothetical protein
MHSPTGSFANLRLASTLFVLAAAAPLGADAGLEAQTLRIGADLPVQIGLEAHQLIYPHLAIHPTNPEHLLGTVWVTGPAATLQERGALDRCATMLSLDGGRSWRRHDFPYDHCGDPWVAFTADGRAVFTAMVRHPSVPDRRSTVVMYHSADGGSTWNEPSANLGYGHDHQIVTSDASSPERAGWLYVVSSYQSRAENAQQRASVFVARSRNGGRHFDAPVHIRPNNLLVKAEGAVVLSDGTLVVSYVEPSTVPRESAFHVFPSRRAWVVRSSDGGHTFSAPMFVNDACGPSPRHRFTLSTLVADPPGGPFDDRLYFVCNQAGGGAILLHYSADGGESWSEPRPVHTASVDTSVERVLMGAAVNRDGALGVLWADAGGSAECTDLYFVASVDGGETFLPEQRVASASSCPTVPVGTHVWTVAGAYFGIATDSTGRFRLLWADARDTLFQLRSAVAEVISAEGDP